MPGRRRYRYYRIRSRRLTLSDATKTRIEGAAQIGEAVIENPVVETVKTAKDVAIGTIKVVSPEEYQKAGRLRR